MAKGAAAPLVPAERVPRRQVPHPVLARRRALPTVLVPAAMETTALQQLWAHCILSHLLVVLSRHVPHSFPHCAPMLAAAVRRAPCTLQ
jgi:hypothetical protein